MSLALKWGENNTQNSGLIFFDAVSVYTRNLKGKVTKHPISLGSSITDHFISENQEISVAGVISAADISTNSYLIVDLDGNHPFNVSEAPTPVSVNSTDQSILKKFIPDSIGQFLPDSTPDVVVAPEKPYLIEQVRDQLEQLLTGTVFNEKTGKIVPNIQLVSLYEYSGIFLTKIINNLVITDMRFREDVNTGDGIYFDMKLEQVTFASLKKTTIPRNITNPLKKKASTKDNKGKVDSTPNAGPAPKADIDPERGAVANG